MANTASQFFNGNTANGLFSMRNVSIYEMHSFRLKHVQNINKFQHSPVWFVVDSSSSLSQLVQCWLAFRMILNFARKVFSFRIFSVQYRSSKMNMKYWNKHWIHQQKNVNSSTCMQKWSKTKEMKPKKHRKSDVHVNSIYNFNAINCMQ